MLRIKRLYLFIIQSFIPYFSMTLGICLFILLMQFLWMQVSNFVGKGLELPVLGELFIYAALSFVPMALPLAILLASLMTFGGLGERLELLAIKASGVSLLKAMQPLIILMVLVAIGSFFFQNEATPRINVKFRTLLFSIKQKSPELDIPEGSFYSGIDKYSIYVRKKNPDTRMLYDVMIYDASNGFNKLSVIVCDSAKMRTAANKQFLLLTLYNGQNFSTMSKSDERSFNPFGKNDQYIMRENFKKKEMIRPFDTNFNRMDESVYEGMQISKNVNQLSHDIDSMRIELDSMNKIDRKVVNRNYLSHRIQLTAMSPLSNEVVQQTDMQSPQTAEEPLIDGRLDFDSIMSSLRESDRMRILDAAVTTAENNTGSFLFQTVTKSSLQHNIRLHEVERSRKFALAFACIVFFFIGAPLGAIIRKGGIGMPVVVSVVFFIVYYIFDNVGVKMARDGVWPIWQGVWLSSIILFPIGIFLTYKAINDSALFNTEAYGKFIRQFLRIEQKVDDTERGIELDRIPTIEQLNPDKMLLAGFEALNDDKLRNIVQNYTQYNYNYNTMLVVLNILKDRGDDLTGIHIDSRDNKMAGTVFGTFKKNSVIVNGIYPVVLILLVLYNVISIDVFWWLFIVALAIYGIYYLRSMILSSDFDRSLRIKPTRRKNIKKALGFLCCIPLQYNLIKLMKKELKGENDANFA